MVTDPLDHGTDSQDDGDDDGASEKNVRHFESISRWLLAENALPRKKLLQLLEEEDQYNLDLPM